MDIQVEDLSAVKKKLSFSVPVETVDEEVNSAYKTLRRDVMLPGFRPGKVPRKILEQRFGQQIAAEVSSKLISDAFDKAVEDNELTPVSPPDIDQQDLKFGQPFTFSVTIEVKPKVEIKDYSGIEVPWAKTAATDDEVDEQIESMRKQGGQLQPVELIRPVQDGDVVDCTFSLESIGLEAMEREHVLLSLPDDPYHGFLVELVTGLEAGASGEGKITVPSDYLDDDWAGKTCSAKVTVHEIKSIQYPDVDDEFAKQLGHDTADEMKTAIKFRIQEAKDKGARDDAARALIEKIIASNEFEVAQAQVDQRARGLVQSIAAQIMPGMDQAPQFSLDDLDDERKANVLQEAEYAVRRELILEAVVKQEELKVSDEERDAKIESLAEEMRQPIEAVRGYLMKSGGIEEIAEQLLQDRAIDLLLERAEIVDKVEEPEPEAETADTGADVSDQPDQSDRPEPEAETEAEAADTSDRPEPEPEAETEPADTSDRPEPDDSEKADE